MKEFWQSTNKFYFANISLFASVVFAIILMFAVQFKVESLQDDMTKTEGEITAYEDEIQLLEVEWVYLTRPERLRTLAARYLEDNSYALASQIKDVDQLEKYYLVSYQKSMEQDVALNVEEQNLEKVSF
jgi:hypothetical protein